MDRARFIALLEQQGTVRDYQHQLKRRDGRPNMGLHNCKEDLSGPMEKPSATRDFTQDFTEQKRLEAALQANSRELQLLSEINNALVRAKTEKDLLRNCCRIMVEVGGYRTAWVGFAGEGPDKPIVTIADYGFEEGFLEGINLTWAETGHEDGPVGQSLRTGEVQVEEEICADPLVHSWRTEAVKHGYRMAIALPFRLTDGAIASLAVFGETPGIRTGSERRLMEQIASDLAYGIANQRAEIAKTATRKTFAPLSSRPSMSSRKPWTSATPTLPVTNAESPISACALRKSLACPTTAPTASISPPAFTTSAKSASLPKFSPSPACSLPRSSTCSRSMRNSATTF